ncbi:MULTISPECIES: polysaccharide deacetylase family protein [unclassified Butyricimonas]|uniref:polysaccharide deacetylase family protein n=1 Tax=Butyricimonas TaxID=574697 RepID=UPI000C07A6F3|nr:MULTISPECIES: polysaccharide deacetylase family protein [unclassified Butyricimonas]
MNILTFDIEDWWAYEYYKLGNKVDWLPRLNDYLERILDILEEHGYKATFFILGEMARCAPDVVRKIDRAGHHIGSHSNSHTFLYKFDYAGAEEDTRVGIDSIEQLIGRKITAYRAPAFSISDENKYIFEILHKYGIEIDSSVFPANRSFGGFNNFQTDRPAIVEYNGIRIKEYPIPMVTLCGKSVAYSGGGYFRLFPYGMIRSFVREHDYVMTYFHMKDFDNKQERRYKGWEREPAAIRYFKTYYGLKGSFGKFQKLVKDFEFISLQEADNLFDWQKQRIINI